MKTDTTEKGLESLILRHMTGTDGLAAGAAGAVAESTPAKSGTGWFAGRPSAVVPEFLFERLAGRRCNPLKLSEFLFDWKTSA